MSTDAVGELLQDDVPPGPDHLRILRALEKYHGAIISCCWHFGRRRFARAARLKVRYLEILQEELPSEAATETPPPAAPSNMRVASGATYR